MKEGGHFEDHNIDARIISIWILKNKVGGCGLD
jgi:hypothetical protein